MLPLQLLRVKIAGFEIKPRYVLLSDRYIDLANGLIEVFKQCEGGKREKLDKLVEKFEYESFRKGFHFKLVRGLTHLLYRKTVFRKPETMVDPLKARLMVFRMVSEEFSGFVLNKEDSETVFKKVSDKLRIPVEEVRKAFYATYEEEEVVEKIPDLSPVDLIREYNLSLVQALLFKALWLEVRFKAPGYLIKNILYMVKRFGLMYLAKKVEDGIKLRIEGPAVLLKQTERYGTRIAKVVPLIFQADKWSIEARIKWHGRLKNFKINSGLRYLLPKVKSVKVEFDSTVELEFYKRFRNLGSGWHIEREPEPLITGKSIMVPDFCFEKNGRKVYLEIMGFWTREYVEKKLSKLKRLGNVNMLVALDEQLACSSLLREIPFEVIVYRKSLSPTEVYLKLKHFEKPGKRKESKITVDSEILEKLKSVKYAKLSQLLPLFEEKGINGEQAIKILEELGFEIIWKGLDFSSVWVRKTT